MKNRTQSIFNQIAKIVTLSLLLPSILLALAIIVFSGSEDSFFIKMGLYSLVFLCFFGVIALILIHRKLTAPLKALQRQGVALTHKLEHIPITKKYGNEFDEIIDHQNFVITHLYELAFSHRRMISHFNHDFKSPFNSIVGAISMLKIDPENQATYVDILDEVTQQQLAAIETARMEMINHQFLNAKKIPNREVDFYYFVEDLANEFEKEVKAKKLSILSEVTETTALIPYFQADRAMQCVFLRCIALAKEMSNIHIKNTNTDKEVVLSLQNNGKGFNPDKVEEVFHPNSHLLNSAYNGDKLNPNELFESRFMLRMFGGDIKVDSPGKENGCTFYIHIPILK